MIAKIISHGTDRDEARRAKLISGLEADRAFGVTTNQGFSDFLPAPSGFCEGHEATTAFIGNHRTELLAPRHDAEWEAFLAGLLLTLTKSVCAEVAQRAIAGGHVSRACACRTRPRGARYRNRGASVTAAIRGSRTSLPGLRIHGVGNDSVRFTSNGLTESLRWSRDGDRLHSFTEAIPLRCAT